MENVPDMALYDEGKLLEKIKGSFPRYAVDHRILDAVHYGVPQRRKRLFVQGNRLGLKVVWPKLTVAQRFVTVKDAISDLPVRTPPSLEEVLPYRPESQTEYQVLMRKKVLPEHREVIFDHIIRQVREDDKMIFNLLPQGGKYRDLPKDLQRYRTDIFDDKYWRLINSEPSWTVTAHIRKDAYRYIHPDQCRTLSIREFARLQSFPDHFRFAGPRTERLRQIGNAVPPLLAERIATSLYHQLITKRAWDRRRAQPDSMLQEVRTVEIEASQEPLEFELVYGSETL
jgi:DNA (cytosine-5)-methyltransferase 1